MTRLASGLSIIPVTLLVLTLFLSIQDPGHFPIRPVSAQESQPSYRISFFVNNFDEPSHVANVSVSFFVELPTSVRPGKFGLFLNNIGNGVSPDLPVYQDTDGQYLTNGRNDTAVYSFNFFSLFHASGAPEFYPYESWMLNLTLQTPALYLANTTNVSPNLGGNLPGWSIAALCQQNKYGSQTWPCIHLTRGIIDELSVTILLRRSDFQTLPVRFIPIIMYLIIGVSVLIPRNDLSSKITIYTCLIFFVGAFLLNLSGTLPPGTFALPFAEAALYYILLVAAMFLVESIMEKILPITDFYGVTRLIKFRSLFLLPLMRTLLLVFAVALICSYTFGYQSLIRFYPWVDLPVLEIQILPLLSVGVWILISIARAVPRRE